MHGVRILHYHCNNGQFADNNFKLACKHSKQRLTFCGFNTHFQNRITEGAIQDLSKNTWEQLLYAHQHWPQAVSIALWPYDLQYATHLRNIFPALKDER